MKAVKGESAIKVVFVLLVASIIVVAGIIAVSSRSPSTASPGAGSGDTTTSSTGQTTSSLGQQAYSMVRENVSVPANVTGGISCLWNIPCAVHEGGDPVCCVTLISYRGNYYYLDQVDFQGGAYTAWLTNSTVYCTTPVSGSFVECPASTAVATRTIEAETTYDTTTFSNSSSSVATINGSQSGGGPNPYAPCVILGQPAGFDLAILSDASSVPVAGANVTAVHFEATDVCDGVSHPGDITIAHFQTDGSLWYSLDNSNAGVYNFTVSYLGKSFSFASPQMEPVTGLCLTLYLPSGRMNSTSATYSSTCEWSAPAQAQH